MEFKWNYGKMVVKYWWNGGHLGGPGMAKGWVVRWPEMVKTQALCVILHLPSRAPIPTPSQTTQMTSILPPFHLHFLLNSPKFHLILGEILVKYWWNGGHFGGLGGGWDRCPAGKVQNDTLCLYEHRFRPPSFQAFYHPRTTKMASISPIFYLKWPRIHLNSTSF